MRSPNAAADVPRTLSRLASRAWSAGESTAGPFLFTPSVLLLRDDDVLYQCLQSLYEHARVWCGGLEVPFHVPAVRVVMTAEHTAGAFSVDEEGWTRIEISRDLIDIPRAVWLVMAHEICHHVLEQSGLSDRADRLRNERQTDLLMFVCGFGQLARNGYQAAQRFGSAFSRSHLGYLQPSEHEFAFEWVLAARSANKLQLPTDTQVRFPDLAAGFTIESADSAALQRLSSRVAESEKRQRLLRYYRSKYPERSVCQLVETILDDLERDNR